MEDHAKHLYETYCVAVRGKAFNGNPLPSWEEFTADPKKEVQADAWRMVAKVSLEAVDWRRRV